MENNMDAKNVARQINELKAYNDKIKECLSAIQLLVVDDNNGRLKDSSFKNELDYLSNQIDSISDSIQNMERNLN